MFYCTQGDFYCCIIFFSRDCGWLVSNSIVHYDLVSIEGWSAGKKFTRDCFIFWYWFFDFFVWFIDFLQWFLVFSWFLEIFCTWFVFKFFIPPKVLQLWYFVWGRSFNFGALRWSFIPGGTLSRRWVSLNLYEAEP